MPRPFSELLRNLPEQFVELTGRGMPERIFRDVLLPQVIVRAKKDEAGTRALVVDVVRRAVRALEIDPREISGS